MRNAECGMRNAECGMMESLRSVIFFGGSALGRDKTWQKGSCCDIFAIKKSLQYKFK